jgi:hypothetical protein
MESRTGDDKFNNRQSGVTLMCANGEVKAKRRIP